MINLRQSLFFTLMLALGGAIASVAAGADQQTPTAEQLEFFEKQVRPLFAKHCYQCHSVNAKRVEAKLLLDSRASQLRGGDSGAAIVPGKADESLLIEAVQYESFEMPPKGKLPKRDIDTLIRWVNMGAPWPKEAAPVANSKKEKFDLQKRKSEFWVWQPIGKGDPPNVKDRAWPRSDVDHHILARLEEAGLAPSEDAHRTAL